MIVVRDKTKHRVGRLLFGFGVGFLVAYLAFRWVADPGPRIERQLQETVVTTSRGLLSVTLSLKDLEIVDPVAPNRKVGKTYVYRADDGWEVSGYYRRNDRDLWHPYLIVLDGEHTLRHLKVSDTALLDRQGEDPLLEILP